MITESTNVYTILPARLQGDRIDFVYQHPHFDPIRQFRRRNTKPLGDIITKPKYGLSATGLEDGAFGFLNVQHLTPYGQIIFDPKTYVEDCAENVLLYKDDILIARTGHTLGKAVLIPEEYQGFTYGSFCIRFAVRNNTEERPGFIVRFINSPLGQRQILMLKTGAGKYNINSDQICDIRIPDISGEDQDALIESVSPLEVNAAERQRQATTVRKEADSVLLIELGFEAPSPHEVSYFFKAGSEGRSIWFATPTDELQNRLHYLFYHPRYDMINQFKSHIQTVPLANICAEPILRGEQPTYDDEGEVTVLKTVDLKNGWIDYDNALRVSQDFYDSNPNAQVRFGDVLVASTGYVSMGKVDVYDRDEPALIDGHISRIRLQDNYDPHFVAHFLRSHIGQIQIEKRFTGSSGQIEIQPSDLGRIYVSQVGDNGIEISEQQRIGQIVSEKNYEALKLEEDAANLWQEAAIQLARNLENF